MCVCFVHDFYYDITRLVASSNLSQPSDEIPWLSEPLIDINIGTKEVLYSSNQKWNY